MAAMMTARAIPAIAWSSSRPSTRTTRRMPSSRAPAHLRPPAPPDLHLRPTGAAPRFSHRGRRPSSYATPRTPAGQGLHARRAGPHRGLGGGIRCLRHHRRGLRAHRLRPTPSHLLRTAPRMANAPSAAVPCRRPTPSPGGRTRYVIRRPEIIANARKVHDFLTVGAAAPLQEAAVAALQVARQLLRRVAAELHRQARNFIRLSARGGAVLQRTEGSAPSWSTYPASAVPRTSVFASGWPPRSGWPPCPG